MTAQSLTEYLSDAETTLPDPFILEEAASAVIRLHERNGGATFNLYFGDFSGQKLYAVSVFVERSVRLPGRSIPPQILRGFIQANADLLGDPRNSIGTWYNALADETYLDISTAFPHLQEAFTIAIRYNQIAIFDLHRQQEIETGGTGEPVDDLPSGTERLPAPARVHRRNDNG